MLIFRVNAHDLLLPTSIKELNAFASDLVLNGWKDFRF